MGLQISTNGSLKNNPKLHIFMPGLPIEGLHKRPGHHEQDSVASTLDEFTGWIILGTGKGFSGHGANVPNTLGSV
jgi:hypothetical protein